MISYSMRLSKNEEQHHDTDKDEDDIRLYPSGLELSEQYTEKSGGVGNSIHESVDDVLIEPSCTAPEEEKRQQA